MDVAPYILELLACFFLFGPITELSQDFMMCTYIGLWWCNRIIRMLSEISLGTIRPHRQHIKWQRSLQFFPDKTPTSLINAYLTYSCTDCTQVLLVKEGREDRILQLNNWGVVHLFHATDAIYCLLRYLQTFFCFIETLCDIRRDAPANRI